MIIELCKSDLIFSKIQNHGCINIVVLFPVIIILFLAYKNSIIGGCIEINTSVVIII